MHTEYQKGGTDGEWIRGDQCTVEEQKRNSICKTSR